MDNQHKIEDLSIADKCREIEIVANNLGFDCGYYPVKILDQDYIRFQFSNKKTNLYAVHDISYASITRFTSLTIAIFMLKEYKLE